MATSINTSVTILGVDPGSRATGYGVIEKNGHQLDFVACGVIRPKPKASFPERLREIYNGLCEVIATHQPAFAAVEDVFVSRNPNSALKLGHARGVILLAIAQNGLVIREYPARLVKKTVAGYGNAAKGQMQQVVRALLGLNATPSEDAADALAAAICLAHHEKVPFRPTTALQ